MATTTKMKMVMKGGKKVPAFAADGVGKMKKGGAAGMHKMPDGSMMKDSDMADKMGRAVKRKTADVKGRAMKKGEITWLDVEWVRNARRWCC
jgi:hypothetical protein